MTYRPRAAFAATCAHCGVAFEAQHLARKYCSTPCNALATQARQARRRAPLEADLAAAQRQVAALQDAVAALRDEVAALQTALRAEVAALRADLPPAPDFAVPRFVGTRGGRRRRDGPPRRLDPLETDVHVPNTRLVQRYVAERPVEWAWSQAQEVPPGTYLARAFWVADDATVWIEDNEGSPMAQLVRVDSCPW